MRSCMQTRMNISKESKDDFMVRWVHISRVYRRKEKIWDKIGWCKNGIDTGASVSCIKSGFGWIMTDVIKIKKVECKYTVVEIESLMKWDLLLNWYQYVLRSALKSPRRIILKSDLRPSLICEVISLCSFKRSFFAWEVCDTCK